MQGDVIITGATGFVGSHLSQFYLDLGYRVIGIDDLTTSTIHSRHAKALLMQPRFIFKKASIEDVNVWNQLREASALQPQFIYNFACPASPPLYQALPIKTMMTCVAGTKNVLDYAADVGSIVVHASTSEIYGDPEISPQAENYRGSTNCYGPRACYDEGKRAAEALCYDYHKKCGVDARLVRIFNTYGPHLSPDDGRVVSNFVKQALNDEPLTVYGDGSQTRSLCYVSDLVDVITRLGHLQNNPGEPVNAGNPQEITVKDLAELTRNVVSNVMGRRSRSEIRHAPLPVDDPLKRLPAIERAQNLLGWYPLIDLVDGLTRVTEYMKGGY